jgi:hypothetical protein
MDKNLIGASGKPRATPFAPPSVPLLTYSGPSVTFEEVLAIDDVVSIGRDLYVKSPAALEKVLEKLRLIGYGVKDLRQSEDRTKRGISLEQQERGAWSLWYASLDDGADIRYGKCGSCHGYIPTLGIRSHDHRCPICNAVTYLHFVDGKTEVEFLFDGQPSQWVKIVLRAKRFDRENQHLYLYREVPAELEYFRDAMTTEQVEAALVEYTDKWEAVEEDGVQLIRVNYREMYYPEVRNIEVYDTRGHFHNFSIVKLWGGKEYSEFDRLPVPESFSIYETWRWPLLEPSPTLHERLFSAVHQVSRKDYWHQDGRAAFDPRMYLEMGKFILHFTTLDFVSWMQAAPYFRLDGPGGIEDVAHFCHPAPLVKDEPNIGNTLDAIAGMMEGRRLSGQELRAAARGAGTREFRDLASALIGSVAPETVGRPSRLRKLLTVGRRKKAPKQKLLK